MDKVKNSIFRNHTNVVRKSLLLAFIFVSLVSCGTYMVPRYEIESVLAVTKQGDTIQVPLSEFKRQYNNDTYNNWQFNYGNSWLYWNDWYLRYPSYYSWYYYRPYSWTSYRPRIEQEFRPRITINRGRRNDQINRPYFRSQEQTEGSRDGGRGRIRQNPPTQPVGPRVTTPSQPRQVRGGSPTPSVQQPQPRVTPSRSGGRRPVDF